MVALVIAELPDHELEFFHSWQDAVDAVATDRAQAVVLLRPVTVEQIAEWARAGQAHAPEEHLLPSQAADRDGVPDPRRPGLDRGPTRIRPASGH